ncbi:hypothetical protein [Ruminococcus sp.]|uniref:hypothetical protein n=1 Tax=Ruminococcus sp. TaxID=41978 RepID=UPI002E81766A|nr:hypothetical protein [Ruminococcus sp.]MEE3492625.1 hypothetical protein [Ruminococcus sp.]
MKYGEKQYLPIPKEAARAIENKYEHAVNGNISAKFGLSILAGVSLPALSAPDFSRNLPHLQSYGVLPEQIFA